MVVDTLRVREHRNRRKLESWEILTRSRWEETQRRAARHARKGS